MPVADMSAMLGTVGAGGEGELCVIVVQLQNRRYGLRVDRFVGQHQAIQRPADPFLAGLRVFSGTVVLPDGTIALLINAGDVLRRAGNLGDWTTDRAARTPEAATQAKTILVVDDSEFTRDLIVGVVRDLGFVVAEAVNGKQGVERFRESSPSLVLTDLDMPVMDGFGLIREIRDTAEGRELPVVVLSTRGSPEDRERAAELGADGYLVKTEFTEERLANMIRRFVEPPDG